MKGDPVHWPRSSVDEELEVEVDPEEEEEGGLEGVVLVVLLLPVFALQEPLEGVAEALPLLLLLLLVIPAAATAELISSAVTSGTSRFCEMIHPAGSFASSPR
jgi:hypothetical protein